MTFDSGVTSYFHDDALQRLYKASLISHVALCASQRIRAYWFQLNPYSFETSEIRSAPPWKQLFAMCDELHLILKKRLK